VFRKEQTECWTLSLILYRYVVYPLFPSKRMNCLTSRGLWKCPYLCPTTISCQLEQFFQPFKRLIYILCISGCGTFVHGVAISVTVRCRTARSRRLVENERERNGPRNYGQTNAGCLQRKQFGTPRSCYRFVRNLIAPKLRDLSACAVHPHSKRSSNTL
jgi:hypothetical protein